MKFTISPPDTPSIIDPNWKIEARFVGKTIERESERNPFGGLFPLGGEGAGVPVEILRIDPAHGLVLKLHGAVPQSCWAKTMSRSCVVLMARCSL